MLNYTKNCFKHIALFALLISSVLNASEIKETNVSSLSLNGENISYSRDVNLLEYSSDNIIDSNSYHSGPKTGIGKWASKHKMELAFSGIAIGTGITALALNSKVNKLKSDEKKLYADYLNAPEGSDMDKLWDDYQKAHNETDKIATIRNGFSLATGGITIAVVLSFYIGRP